MLLMFISAQFRLFYFIMRKTTYHKFDGAYVEQTVVYLFLDRLMSYFMNERAHLGIKSEAKSCL